MKRNLLLMLLMLTFGFGISKAYNVRVMVDNAANVEVTTQAGYGETLQLADGMSTFDLSESDQPLVIRPANGAEITEVLVNGSAANKSGDGAYRIGISGAMMIQISTSGGGSSEVEVSFFNMGFPNSASVSTNGTDVSWSFPVKVEKGTAFTISPMRGYGITNVSPLNQGQVTANNDGTYTYTANESNTIYVYTEITGVRFKVTVDCAANLRVALGNEMEEVAINNGVNNIVTEASMQPILFEGIGGASIASVTRNGETVNPSPYGTRSAFADGDEFVVTTVGPEITLNVVAAEGNAPLEAYTFKVGDTVLDLSGTSATATLRRGEIIYVTPKGANTLTFITGGEYVAADAPTQAARISSDGLTLTVYGTMATGVNIDVDSAERVIIRQSNGFGAPLNLVDGLNRFTLSEIGNPLKVSAAEGCKITSVLFNGNEVAPGNDGSYLVSATEDCSLQITSKVIPTSIPVSVFVTPAENYDGVVIEVDGDRTSLESGMQMLTLTPGAVVTVSSLMGYTIESCEAGRNPVQYDDTRDTWTFRAEEPCNLMLSVNKIEARPGYSLVKALTNDALSVSFRVYNQDEYVKSIRPNEVAEVMIGSEIEISTFSSATFFSSVTANGVNIEPQADNKKLYVVKITDPETEIIADTYLKILIGTNTTYNSENHSIIGELFVKDGDELVTNYYADLGETVTFVAKPSPGYSLDYIKRYYPESNEKYGMTYTVTEADSEIQMAIFEGVYTEEEKPYLVRGNNTYAEIDGTNQRIGYVMIVKPGVTTVTGMDDLLPELLALPGESVTLQAIERDDYEFVRFVLWRDNEVTLSNPYIVDPAQADSTGTIEVAAIFRERAGINAATVDSDLTYDAATSTITSSDSMEVYDTNGTLLLSSPGGSLSLRDLTPGLYIAVSGNRAMKIQI